METTKNPLNLVTKFVEDYKEAINNTDPRVRDYFLIGDGSSIFFLVLGYYLFIIIGTRVMKNRPAFNVPAWIIFTYNFGLTLLSLYMFEEFVVGVYQSNYNMLCAKLSQSKSPAEMKVVNVIWWYFFSKVIEFFDTFFMVIRKKFNQVTFLHVYHHSTMFVIWWIAASWIPGGQIWLGACLNCAVHVVMYLYYALSVIPSLKDKLWWKKYITMMQLGQFLIVFVHVVRGLVTSCDYPMWAQYLLVFYMLSMIVLFSNFFVQEYLTKSNAAKRIKIQKDINNNHIKPLEKKID